MTREDFEFYIPSAVMPDDALFERIAAHLDEGEAAVKSLLGGDLYAVRAQDLSLDNLCKRMACLAAYKGAMAHLDVVLTDNGFGVVNNANVAPASAERVARLRQQVQDDLDDTVDALLECLRGDARWVDSETAKGVFCSLVWNARRQLVYFGIPNGHRSQLDELRVKIASAEVRIKQCVSPEFFAELCDALRLAKCDAMQNTAIHKILLTVGADATGDHAGACWHVKKLVEWLDGNIRAFPTYANSSAYAANTFEPYRNGKDDACFFWG